MPDTIDHGNAFSVPASGNGQRHGSLPNDDDEWDKWGAGGEPLNWDPAPCDAEQPQPPVAAPASMPLTQPGNRVITPAELAAASERGKAIVGIALRNRELRPVLLGEHDICSTLASVCGDWGGVF